MLSIKDELPKEIIDFLNSEELSLNIVNQAVSFYEEEYNLFPKNSVNSLNSMYDTDKAIFYKKYLPFAQKCKEFTNIQGTTGYKGLDDFVKFKIMELCRFIDYTFPYGWKIYHID